MMLNTALYVLKSKNQGDSDRVYTVFSKKYGKIDILAKGARKTLAKLSGYLERPAKASVSLAGGQTLRLISALSQSQYLQLKDNLTSLGLSLKGLDLANKLILAPEPDTDIWKLIGGFLDAEEVLAKQKAPLWQKHLAYYYFIIKLITILGYGLEDSNNFEQTSSLTPDTSTATLTLGSNSRQGHPDTLKTNLSTKKWLMVLSKAKNFKEASIFFDTTEFPRYWEKEFKTWNTIFRKIIKEIPSLE